MKANTFTKENDEAQVGIGTMIVFIATILVAAVAAGVLIDTSQKLQDKSTQTGVDATQEVGTSVEVLHVYGERDKLDDGDNDGDITETPGADDAPSEGLDLLKVQVRLAPGATPIDVSKLKVTFDDGTSANFRTYSHRASQSDAITDEFTVAWVVGSDADNIMAAGDVVEIQIGDHDSSDAAGPPASPDNDLQLGTRTAVTLTLIPDQGTTVSAGFTTPVTYGTDKVFELF